MSGQVAERSSIAGAFNVGNSQLGTFSLTFDPQVTDTPVGLNLLQGTWGNQDPSDGYTTTLTIDASGQLTGSDSDGCQYSATISVISPSVNVYRISGSYTCPGEGTQSGNGLLVRVVNGSIQTIVLGLSNQSIALATVLNRQ